MTLIRVCDTETTGLTKDDKVCEVAFMDVAKRDGRWVKVNTGGGLVNPGRPIPPEASAIHHITDTDVANAPLLDNYLPMLLDGTPTAYCAHNAKFDRMFLPTLPGPWLCTYKIGATCWPDSPNYSNQCLRYFLGLKLADPLAAIPHRAPGDAYVTAAILARALTDFVVTVDELIQISAAPVILKRIPFGEHAMKPFAEVPTGYLQWVVRTIKDNEDVVASAVHALAQRRDAARGRSPVQATPPGGK